MILMILLIYFLVLNLYELIKLNVKIQQMLIFILQKIILIRLEIQ